MVQELNTFDLLQTYFVTSFELKCVFTGFNCIISLLQNIVMMQCFENVHEYLKCCMRPSSRDQKNISQCPLCVYIEN